MNAVTNRDSTGRRWSKAKRHWKGYSPLELYCRAPTRYPQEVLDYDSELVVVYDKYPKAYYHFLILPRVPILNIYGLTRADIPLIQRMERRAKQLITQLRTATPPIPSLTAATVTSDNNGMEVTSTDTRKPLLPLFRDFLVGFHSIPSVPQLHLHVISDDLLGPYMKGKGKWNTFATPFLRTPQTLAAQLSHLPLQPTNATLPYNEATERQYFNVPIHCLHCHQPFAQFKQLRAHIPACLAQNANLAQGANNRV
ncbi:aprataxin-like protein [Dimargaris verticillata]|uniref:Aprataxin-like protein n=1 Tax=Dimargaris verticillata TaxID=2761393 RepID=A0A9W8B3T5_9FUNG|nr:aprataxin-like protein [Dimargaris verticillata]